MSDPRLTVVVPAYNGATVLSRSLPALRASDLPRSHWELIVVDDGSTDETARVAERHADRVLRLDGTPRGPAHARNHGSEAARGEILVFVDADVCVHPDALAKLLQTFGSDAGVGAAFGAYDSKPRASGFVSQYRNLLHRYVHLAQAGEAETFWAGCGAVRRSAFVEAGRFDGRRYSRPQVEDIELGYRLRSLGWRILLRPDVQGTHLKRWTLRNMVVSDVRDRALPWMRLLLERRGLHAGTLNVRTGERVLTGAAAVFLFCLLAAPFGAAPLFLGIAGACLLLILLGNAPLFRWFARTRNVWFALGIVPLRLLYYVLNAAVALVVLVEQTMTRMSNIRGETLHGNAAGEIPRKGR